MINLIYLEWNKPRLPQLIGKLELDILTLLDLDITLCFIENQDINDSLRNTYCSVIDFMSYVFVSSPYLRTMISLD